MLLILLFYATTNDFRDHLLHRNHLLTHFLAFHFFKGCALPPSVLFQLEVKLLYSLLLRFIPKGINHVKVLR